MSSRGRPKESIASLFPLLNLLCFLEPITSNINLIRKFLKDIVDREDVGRNLFRGILKRMDFDEQILRKQESGELTWDFPWQEMEEAHLLFR